MPPWPRRRFAAPPKALDNVHSNAQPETGTILHNEAQPSGVTDMHNQAQAPEQTPAPKNAQPATPIRVVKTGRNERCPCGSGIKYKRCCLGRRQPAAA